MCLRARCWVRGYNMVHSEMSSIIIIYPGYCPSPRWSWGCGQGPGYHENVTGCNWLLSISSYLAMWCLISACVIVHSLHFPSCLGMIDYIWLLWFEQFCTQDKHVSRKEAHILGNCNRPEEDLHKQRKYSHHSTFKETIERKARKTPLRSSDSKWFNIIVTNEEVHGENFKSLCPSEHD